MDLPREIHQSTRSKQRQDKWDDREQSKAIHDNLADATSIEAMGLTLRSLPTLAPYLPPT